MLDAVERFFRAIGWSPQLARIAMWALLLMALGSVLNLKIKV